MQNWEDVGLKTELATGQLIEFNTFNDMKDNDDDTIEVFFGAWSVGTDPDPSGLWHSTAEWNYGRWLNEESDELLEDGLSEDAFDEDYRKQVYVDWQKLYNEIGRASCRERVRISSGVVKLGRRVLDCIER